MELITTKTQIESNIVRVEEYLTGFDDEQWAEMAAYISRGICFIAYKVGKETRFVPSKFIGHTDNTLEKHALKQYFGGTQTNQRISSVLGIHELPNDKLEQLFLIYCRKLGIIPKASFNHVRKFWLLEMSENFTSNQAFDTDFPEGRIVERTHISRERNPQVIQQAKARFQLANGGKLFCEVCGFSFSDFYGKAGEGFIEGHHIIPVSEMQPGHRTTADEIVLLCANCHRMIHRRRPWLTRQQLHLLIDKE